MQLVDEILKRINTLPKGDKAALVESVAAMKNMWTPSPGPQMEAYFSPADILLFGGEPGGGKTELLLGLAFNEHKRSLILRRQYTDLSNIVERLIAINGTRKGFNGSPPPSLRRGNQTIDLGACSKIGDEQQWQGRPHDLICFDEGAQFAEAQVRFLMGWLRSVDQKQRKRVVIATNPPLSSEGLWLMQMFAPWLDQRHPNPAQPGELRWFITDDEGAEKEVDNAEQVLVRGAMVKPLSRTFIPSGVADNPFLAGTDYESQLAAMPEPFRSVLLGKFQTVQRDQYQQLIPTEWIRSAQQRWTPSPRLGVPMCSIGVDVACAGDETVLAPRYDGWFAPLTAVPGKETFLGSDIAGLIFAKRKGDAIIVLDMGGGYGNSAYEHLTANHIPVIPYNGANRSDARTKDRQLAFVNRRAQTWWRFREALDPDQEGGSPIMLPDDPKLLADLASPTFAVKPNGIQVESKDEIKKRLGRSPDRGDAVVMAWSQGPVFKSDGGDWIAQREHMTGQRRPTVVTGRRK